MSSTDSDGLEKVVGIPPELVVGLVQNEWTASIRIDGRHEPEHASGRVCLRKLLKEMGNDFQLSGYYTGNSRRVRDAT